MTDEQNNNPEANSIEQSPSPAVQEGRYRELRNGAVYDMDEKRIVANPGGGTGAIRTSAQGREMQARRQVKAAQVVRQAIAEADTTQAHANANKDVYGGWKTIALAQTQLALSWREGRASTEAAKWLGKAAGLMQEAEAGQAAASPLEALGAETARELVRFLRQRRGE